MAMYNSLIDTSLWISISSLSAKAVTHLLCHILTALQVMVTVWKDLRLNNGNDAMLGW